VLLHWHAAEAAARAARLRAAGYTVVVHSRLDAGALRALRERPPDALVIDLGRRPAQGRDLALWLRQQRATRSIPLVIVEGDAEQTARVRELLPDAVFTVWRRMRSAVRAALDAPPATPVVPGAMAGYRGTPLPRKLGIRAGAIVALLGAPADFAATLGDLPAGVRIRRRAGGEADLIVLFAASAAELERRFPAALRTLAAGGALWIAWPKQASGVASDLTQAAVRAFGMAAGLVDYKICAIDATWSGLCFAHRRRGSSGRCR
jgi:CheY-like chemotaxis protein